MLDLNTFRGTGPVSYDELDLALQSVLKDMLSKASSMKSLICNSIPYSFITSTRITSFKLHIDNFDPEHHFMDLFVNGRYVSKNTYEYNKLTNEITLSGYVEANSKVFYIIYEYQNHNIKLFLHYDVDVTLDNQEYPDMVKSFPIPYDPSVLTTTKYFEMYRDGYLVDVDTYSIDYVNNTITMDEGRAIPKGTKLVFSFIASYTRCLTVNRLVYTMPTTLRGRFRTDLNETLFNKNKHIVRLFCNGGYVADTDYVVSRNVISITSQENYHPERSTKTVILREYKIVTGYDEKELQKTNTEEFFVNVPVAKDTPIPILDFHEDNTSFGLFKENGVFVNSAKYYVDNGDIKFYDHDKGLEQGDILNFNVTEKEGSIREFSIFVELTEKNQTHIVIPLENFEKRKVTFMLFRSEGVYISYNKYIVENGNVVITYPMRFDPGDVLEFRFLEYISDTRYIRKRATEEIMVDAQKELTIPWNDYNPETDNILLLRSDGIYIGKNRYTINYNTGKITINSGSIMTYGKWVDFILNRTLPEPIPVELAYEEGGIFHE